jgi:hypothetical protein
VGLGEALWLFVTLRVTLSLFALMLSNVFAPAPPCFHHGVDEWQSMPQLASEGMSYRLLGVWERWDACWYLRIAEFGYEPGEPATAFFPLYPALIKAAGTLLGGQFVLGSLIVVAVAYVAAIAGLYRLVLRDFDEGAAQRTVLYLSVFPTAFFMFAPFTEALFLATSVWALYCARIRRWEWAGAAALLAGLTRFQGAALAPALAWEAFCLVRSRGVPAPRDWKAWSAYLLPALAVLAPLVGPLLFYIYTDREVGLSTLQAQQQHWGSTWHAPWTVVRAAWDWSFNQPDSPWRDLQAINAFNLFILLLFWALFAAGLRYLPLSYSLLVAPQLLLISTRILPTPLTSTARHVLVLFPAFVVLALIGRQRRINSSWLIFSLLALGLLLSVYLQNTFVA